MHLQPKIAQSHNPLRLSAVRCWLYMILTSACTMMIIIIIAKIRTPSFSVIEMPVECNRNQPQLIQIIRAACVDDGNKKRLTFFLLHMCCGHGTCQFSLFCYSYYYSLRNDDDHKCTFISIANFAIWPVYRKHTHTHTHMLNSYLICIL